MIWIMLPVFNEEMDLPFLLKKFTSVMKGKDYHLVVIDDGSTDKTQQILEKFKDNLNLEVLNHPINRGLGETERDGFEYIASQAGKGDYIVRIEGNDTQNPKFIFSLIDKLEEGYDVVISSRFLPGGAQEGRTPCRSFISRCANFLLRVIFRIPGVTDYSSGYRVYRVKVLQDALAIFGNHLIELHGVGFTSKLEIIIKLHLLGCRFSELPVVFHYGQKRGESKMVASITTFGYFLVAFLYLWPFGGWRKRYRELRDLYKENPVKALEKYSRYELKSIGVELNIKNY